MRCGSGTDTVSIVKDVPQTLELFERPGASGVEYSHEELREPKVMYAD